MTGISFRRRASCLPGPGNVEYIPPMGACCGACEAKWHPGEQELRGACVLATDIKSSNRLHSSLWLKWCEYTYTNLMLWFKDIWGVTHHAVDFTCEKQTHICDRKVDCEQTVSFIEDCLSFHSLIMFFCRWCVCPCYFNFGLGQWLCLTSGIWWWKEIKEKDWSFCHTYVCVEMIF